MKYIVMHKADAAHEAGAPPPANILRDMGAFVGKAIADKIFVDGAGLHRSGKRARVAVAADGAARIVHGPYAGDRELVAGLVMIEAQSLADAAVHVAEAARDAAPGAPSDFEVGAVVEPWDLGLVPAPEGAPQRFLVLVKGDAPPLTPRVLATALEARTIALAAAELAPSSEAIRAKPAAAGKRSWVDGPFAESKELVGGYSIIDVPDLAAARAWAEAYGAILVDNEVDVRRIVT